MRRRTAMDKIEMERLFERLLNESDVAGKDDGVDRAALLRALKHAKASEIGGDAADNLAAYLDAADMFLDAVSAEEHTAPAELVAAAAQDAQRQQVKSVVRRGRFLNSAAW